MEFTAKVHSKNLTQSTYHVLIVPAWEDQPMPSELKELDKSFKGALSSAWSDDVLKDEGEVFIVPSRNINNINKGIRRVAFVGMGKCSELNLETVRRAAGKSANSLRKHNLDRIAYFVDPFMPDGESLESTAQALLEGARLGAYTFDTFKSEKDTKVLLSVELHIDSPHVKVKDFQPMIDETLAVTTSTLLARDWANTPSNYSTPSHLAKLAGNIAREAGLSIKVLDSKECERLGMGAFLGVARGSETEPKFIVLDYKPKRYSKTLALVGKALTFDSGGISLKPALDMHVMKADMGGGIAVLATMRAVGIAAPDGVRIVGIVPACENMPGGNAQKPGDIVRTRSGKSIEVLNTDAEGRLVLADGIEYAVSEYEPDAIVDVATLTGACVIALGLRVAGIFTDHDDLASAMEAASKLTGEKVWRMPLEKEYVKLLKSTVADTANIGLREGGAITAALFLQKFTSDKPWIHIDIAGPMWTQEPLPYAPKGATGYGPRLLYNFIKIWSAP